MLPYVCYIGCKAISVTGMMGIGRCGQRLRPRGPGTHGVHGRGRHGTAGNERVQDAQDGHQGAGRVERDHDPQGRQQRGHARLGHERGDEALHHRQHGGPHPSPTSARDYQAITGKEIRAQSIRQTERKPDLAIACVDGGSNASGTFRSSIDDTEVTDLGVESDGSGTETDKHCATLYAGTPGVLHGSKTIMKQTDGGQIKETYSISAGPDYPDVRPKHVWLNATNRAEYASVTDTQALEGLQTLFAVEDIIPALETAHAVHEGLRCAKAMSTDKYTAAARPPRQPKHAAKGKGRGRDDERP